MNGRLVSSNDLAMDHEGRREITSIGGDGMFVLRITNATGTWLHSLRVPIVGN